MNRALMKIALVLMAPALLVGCSTPGPVLDLAGRGAGAVTQAETELKRYLAATENQLSARLAFSRQLSAAELEENYADQFRKYLQDQSGEKTSEEVINLIQTLGKERRRLREERAAELAKLDELHVKALAGAAHPSSAAFTASKVAFTALTEELTPQEWLALTAVYARAINGAVKKIQDDAKAAAPK